MSDKRQFMKKQYDVTKARKNPYAARLKKQVTMRIDETTIAFFKNMAASTGIPYQTLMNLYLRECAEKGKRLEMKFQ